MTNKNKTARKAMQAEALRRAENGTSVNNETIVIEAFVARGIDESDIEPRVNVLTFHAWKAKGRSVRKGEKGVRLETWIPIKLKDEIDEDTGKAKRVLKRKVCHVFHVSQTDKRAA